MAPIARVAAPPVTPPRFSLVASAGASGGTRWETGFKWDGVICGSGGGLLDLCTPSSITFDLTDWQCDDRAATPYVVYEPVAMSTFRNSEDAAAEATRRLERFQSIAIESEFWLGTFATAEANGNLFLADGNATAVGAGALPMLQGLAALQGTLAQVGVQGFIHMSAYVFGLLVANGVEFSIDGNIVRDVFGNVVVPGAGYPFDDSTPDTATIFGTGAAEVRLGPIETTEAVDQTNNVKYAVAYRVAAATFDPCVQLEVDLDLCNLNCSAA